MTHHWIRASLLGLFLVLGGCRDEGQTASVPGQAACARLMSLCNGNATDRAQCEHTFAQLNPTVDRENAMRTARCMTEARSCGEGSGCMSAGAARAGATFLRDFTNGFTR